MEETIPIEIGRFVNEKGKEVFGFSIITTGQKGEISQLAHIFSDRKLNIIYMTSSYRKREEKRPWIFFMVDFTGSKFKPEDIVNEINKLEFVESVRLIKPIKNGIFVDSIHFPIIVGGERSIIFRVSIIDGLINTLKRQLGEAGRAFLYHEGFRVGRNLYKTYKNWLKKEDPHLLSKIITVMSRVLGYGIAEVAELSMENKEAKIIIYDSFERRTAIEKDEQKHNFIRGILAGFFTEIFKILTVAKETQCPEDFEKPCIIHVFPKEKEIYYSSVLVE